MTIFRSRTVAVLLDQGLRGTRLHHSTHCTLVMGNRRHHFRQAHPSARACKKMQGDGDGDGLHYTLTPIKDLSKQIIDLVHHINN